MHHDHCEHEHEHDHEHGCGCCEETVETSTKGILIAISSALLLAAIILGEFSMPLYVTLPIYVAAYLVVGSNCFIGLYNEFREKNFFSEYLLMTVATVGAFAISEYTEAVLVMIFHCIGTVIEDYSVSKSKNSVRSLLDGRPEKVERKNGEIWESVPLEDIAVGDVVRIKAGEIAALDGVVTGGGATVDTSSVTGESRKYFLSENDKVLSGFVNLDGVIEITVTSDEKHSTLSEIVRLVEEGNKNKSNAEKTLSVFAKYYTPAVMFAAIAIAVICPLIWGNFVYFFREAMLLLVASCPCSLLIGIPLSFYCGIGGMAKNGVLVKGGGHIEKFSKLRAVAFDKTGTLTTGDFGITEIFAENKEELFDLLCAAEYYSTHSLSEPFKNGKISPSDLSDFTEIAGRGVFVKYKDKPLFAGNAKLMRENGIVFPDVKEEKGSVIFAAYDGEYKGRVILGDIIRSDAEQTLSELKKNGVEKTVLLTGDGKTNAELLANTLKIDEVKSSLLPKDKVENVLTLSEKYDGNVAFVGDGINDAPVLAKAPMSVAIAKDGNGISASAADAVLLGGKLSGISKLVSFSKKTMRLVRFDIVSSLAVKFGVMAGGFFGLPMYAAVFADVGLTVIYPLLAYALFKSAKKDR